MNILDYLPLSQAAQALGYANSSTLRQYCIAGRIPGATKLGNQWVIPRTWVKDELKNPTLAPQGGRGFSRK